MISGASFSTTVLSDFNFILFGFFIIIEIYNLSFTYIFVDMHVVKLNLTILLSLSNTLVVRESFSVRRC